MSHLVHTWVCSSYLGGTASNPSESLSGGTCGLSRPSDVVKKKLSRKMAKKKKERKKGTKILLLDQPYISSIPIDMLYSEPADYNEGSQLDLRKTII